MPVIGFYCQDKKMAQEAEDAIRLLLAKRAAGSGEFASAESAGTDYEIRRLFSPEEPPDESSGHSLRMLPDEPLSFLLLGCKTIKETVSVAEKLWIKRPSLSVICVISCAQDVFEALTHPFFHVVRGYALEQDLSAALQKMDRIRPFVPQLQFFQCRNGMAQVKRRDILYLESDRHEIKVHCTGKIFITVETLAQCEEKLKGKDFARIHKSFLVNFYHVSRMERESLVLDDGKRLYISRYRYPEVKRQFENYIRRLDFL